MRCCRHQAPSARRARSHDHGLRVAGEWAFLLAGIVRAHCVSWKPVKHDSTCCERVECWKLALSLSYRANFVAEDFAQLADAQALVRTQSDTAKAIKV